MPSVTIRYWAAAKEAAGLAEETLVAATLGDALAAALARHASGRRLEAVVARSSLLVDGKQARHGASDDLVLWEGAIIEVLPPFAGG
jgi:sulfur-carrier protein